MSRSFGAQRRGTELGPRDDEEMRTEWWLAGRVERGPRSKRA